MMGDAGYLYTYIYVYMYPHPRRLVASAEAAGSKKTIICRGGPMKEGKASLGDNREDRDKVERGSHPSYIYIFIYR